MQNVGKTGEKVKTFIPFNRYLLVQKIEQELDESISSILVPEGVTVRPEFSLVELLAIAPDCEKFNGEVGQTIVVNSNMIENVKINNQDFDIIQENHVIGLMYDDSKNAS
jgi:co-chaperonin GroES (HSP10)